MVPQALRYILRNVAAQWTALVANVVLMLLIGLFLQRLFDGVAVDGWVVMLLGAGVAVIAVRMACLTYAQRMGVAAAAAAKRSVRRQVYDKLVRMGPGYSERIATSEAVQVSVEGCEQLESYFGQYLPQLLYAVLAQQFRAEKTEGNLNNEIGLPLTLMRMTKDTEVMVAEMGMNHFGELSRMTASAQPDYAVITNIGTSHIEFLGSREGICRAKLEILEGLRQGGAAVLCGDEPLLWDKRDSLGCTVYTYGMENQACDLVAHLHPDGSFTVINNGLPSETLPVGGSFTAKLSIPGAHNVLNALAAASVGLLMGETVENIRTGLVSYTASGMRQNIYEQNGFRIYADCYNASPDAMEATLGVLGTMGDTGRRIAVLGSMLELGDYTEEGHRRAGRAAAEHADVLYAYGPSADAIARGAEEKGMTAVHAFTDQNELVEKLRADAKPGDALLFKGSRGMRMERALALFLGEEVE